MEKGAVIALPYGVEGFAIPKHLVKADGSRAQLDEKLEFKVLEFNKASKRIILSHRRPFEDEQKGERAEQPRKRENARGERRGGGRRAAEETPVLTTPLEKTTLGDLEALASLKEKLAGK